MPSAPATPHLQHPNPHLAHPSSTPVLNAACSANNRELQSILKEVNSGEKCSKQRERELKKKQVRFMTSRLKVKDEEDKVVADWKFAAMVIDR